MESSSLRAITRETNGFPILGPELKIIILNKHTWWWIGDGDDDNDGKTQNHNLAKTYTVFGPERVIFGQIDFLSGHVMMTEMFSFHVPRWQIKEAFGFERNFKKDILLSLFSLIYFAEKDAAHKWTFMDSFWWALQFFIHKILYNSAMYQVWQPLAFFIFQCLKKTIHKKGCKISFD